MYDIDNGWYTRYNAHIGHGNLSCPVRENTDGEIPMSVLDRLKTVVERLHSSASVESVYGDPIEANGRTIIPVSKVAYGFGAGYGSSPDDETPAEQHAQESEGGGLGGGVAAQPAGVVEITESRTTFVRPTFTLRQITLLVVCLLIGYMPFVFG